MSGTRTARACLAVDLGASSGRVIAGVFDAGRLQLREVHRFGNGPVRLGDSLVWDFDALVREVKQGLRLGIAQQRDAGAPVRSIGIDTWGVDFGLLDESGALMGPPVCYRDERTQGMMDAVFREDAPRELVFRETGIQFLPFNTIYQLAALKRTDPATLAKARRLLMMPDLFHYLLTGVAACEYTDATTTQLFNPRTRAWSEELIARLGLPRGIFGPVVEPGTRMGALKADVAAELGADDEIVVIAVATHDTASAVAAVPAAGNDFAYLSCGTWSLLGTEVREPVITDEAFAMDFTNEGGVTGTCRLLKNIAGLWLLQETRAEWERRGRRVSWADMSRMAQEGGPFRSFVQPDDPAFIAPGDMTPRIAEFCRRTGQPVPENDAQVVRCVLESLAMRYRQVLGMLESLVGRRIGAFHMVGGGIQNSLLCQWTADAIGREVSAGPVEGTAIGNIAVQLMAAGEIGDLSAARAMVRESFPPERYQPRDSAAWASASARFEGLA